MILKKKLLFPTLSALLIMISLPILNHSLASDRNNYKIPQLTLSMPGDEISLQNIKSDAKLDSLPNTAMLYKINHQSINKDDVIKKASVFGLSGTVNSIADDGNGHYILGDSNHTFSHHKDTNEFFYLENTPVDKAVSLPSQEEAKNKSLQLLKQLNISTDDLQFSSITYQTTQIGSQQPIQTAEKVYFMQTLNGQPLYGVARVCIIFGDNGKVIGFYNLKKDFSKDKNIPLKNPNDAINQIHQKGLINLPEEANDHNGTIHSARLAYWASPDSDQGYIQPIYLYSGNTDKDNYQFSAYLPAVDESYTIPIQETTPNLPNAKINPPKQ